MSDTILKWVKAAPIPALIIALFVYIYSVDSRAGEADKNAAVAVESKREQVRRLERIEEKVDALTEAVAQLNLATTVRLNNLETRRNP